MKKIFTLIAVAAMALSASAQEITFTIADVVSASSSAPLNNKTFSNGNFSIVVTDLEGKFAIDNPTAAFFGTAEAYKSYAYRLKTGATSKPAGDAKARYITIKAPSAGTVKICARSGSSSSDRNIEINGTKKLLDDDAAAKVDMPDKASETNPTGTTPIYQIHEFAVNAGDNTLTFPDGSVNFYSFEFVAGEGGGGETPTPVTPTDPSAAKVWDFTNMSADALAALAANTASWAADVQGTGEEAYTRYTYKTDIAKDTYKDLASIGFSDGAGIEVGRSGGTLAGYAQKSDGSWSGGIRVDANKRIQLNTSNGVFKIKNLKAGDKVTINYQSGSDEARSFSVTNATPATLSAPKNSEEGSIKTETLTVSADGDVTLQQTKAINIFKIAVNSEITAIASVEAAAVAAPAVKKYVENGKVVIVKDGKKFNIAGAQLK